MRRPGTRRSGGATLAEMVVTMVFLTVGITLSVTAIRLLNSFRAQTKVIEAQRDASRILYVIAKDVRNAFEVRAVEPGRLELRVFDSRLRDRPEMFDAAQMGTLTWTFVDDRLEYHVAYPDRETRVRYLEGRLRPPTATNPIFQPIDSSLQGVRITLELRPQQRRAMFVSDMGQRLRTDVLKRAR